MSPLDLSKGPPRSGHERLAGIRFLARTVDKVRAQLPGGNPGPYKIPGISERMLVALGIEETKLQEIVRTAATEEEVGSWVRDQAGKEKMAAWEAVSLQPIRDAAQRASLTERYPLLAGRADVQNLIDLLDADEGRPLRQPEPA